LKKMKTLPSELCTDAEFTAVFTGFDRSAAAPEGVRAFLADETRSRKTRKNSRQTADQR